MKGVIFNIAENFLEETYGEETLDEILSNCNLETKEPFVGPGTYPDSDLMEIIEKSSEKLSINQNELLVNLGRYAFEGLSSKFPNFLEGHSSAKSFLQTVDGIIHVEVRKLYKDTYLPTFQYLDPAPDKLTITYYSKRKLYGFMEGLIQGVAKHFNCTIAQEISLFDKDGEEFCDFALTFS